MTCEVIALRHPPARPPYRVAGARVTALGVGTACGRARAGARARGRGRAVAAPPPAPAVRSRPRAVGRRGRRGRDHRREAPPAAGRRVGPRRRARADPRHRLRRGPRAGRAMDGRGLVPWRGPRDGRIVHGPRRDPRTAARATGRAAAPGRRHDRLPTGRSGGGRGGGRRTSRTPRPPDDPVRRQPRAGQGPRGHAAGLRSPGGRPARRSTSSSWATAGCAPGWRRRSPGPRWPDGSGSPASSRATRCRRSIGRRRCSP